ncbi:MAG: group II intron reverse transcriptase/maturase, partial [Nitrospiraceae bacterium]
PKPGTAKWRRLGIPTVRDRVVQAALKLVLEPLFEADFLPCSYGFRPNRRAQDALAEIHTLCSRSYEWVVEGDIKACFDEIDHAALMRRVRERIGDKRVLALIKAFCKAGLLTEAGQQEDTPAGTPQGGILSPLLANIALSGLDAHFAQAWEAMGTTSSARQARRRQGLATYRLVRYADDFVVVVAGTRDHADTLRTEVDAVIQPMGLRLSEEKTTMAHIDQGFEFLGFRIQRHRKRGTRRRYVYTWPCKTALATVKARVRTLTRTGRDLPLTALLHQLNPVLRGWTAYFQYGGVEGELQRPPRVYLAESGVLAAPQTLPSKLEDTARSLSARVVAHAERRDAVQPGRGAGFSLPVPQSNRVTVVRAGLMVASLRPSRTCREPDAW